MSELRYEVTTNIWVILQKLADGKIGRCGAIEEIISIPELAIANRQADLSFKAGIREVVEETKPYLEEATRILNTAQGEWVAISHSYAPEWTHELREAIALIQQAIGGNK